MGEDLFSPPPREPPSPAEADVAKTTRRQQCTERTEHDLRCSIYRSAIGQIGFLICARHCHCPHVFFAKTGYRRSRDRLARSLPQNCFSLHEIVGFDKKQTQMS